jgi:hypothetical protein
VGRRVVGGSVPLPLIELVYLGEANFGGSAPELSMKGEAFRLKKNFKTWLL